MTHVFIFAGQSNMAGADAPPDPVQPCLDLVDLGLQTSADKAALLTYAAGIEPTSPVSMPWGDVRGHCGAVGGQIQDPEGKSYKVIGPEVGFVRHLAEWNHPPVAIIKATANFQSLYDERSPWLTEGPLGSKWRTFVAESLSSLATIAPDHKIAGIVWFQGIDDALLSRPRVEYQRDLAAIIAATQTPKHPNTHTIRHHAKRRFGNCRSSKDATHLGSPTSIGSPALLCASRHVRSRFHARSSSNSCESADSRHSNCGRISSLLLS